MRSWRIDRRQVSSEEFAALFRDLSAWGRWGDDDERGALNQLTPGHVSAATQVVHEGVTVSLSWPLNAVAAADNPHPAEHRMTALGGDGALNLVKDYVGAAVAEEVVVADMAHA